jgi:uncharacterized protein HemX
LKTNTGLIVGLVVSVLLAAVFAVLWYGAQEDNKLLTRQVIYLTQQLQGNLSLLQKTSQQLAETQKQLQDTQKQLHDTQNQLRDTQERTSVRKYQVERKNLSYFLLFFSAMAVAVAATAAVQALKGASRRSAGRALWCKP